MLVNIFNWLKGYVIIEVKGKFLERFINLCINKGIYLWNIKKSQNTLKVCISVRGFKLLRAPCRKTGSVCNIKSKKGLPFVLKRHKKRKAFLVGLILFFIAIFYLSSFVWVIEIEKTDNISTDEIRNILTTCGFTSGMLKYKIDPEEIKNKALLTEPRLSWLWVNVKGTVAYVEVKEKRMAEPPIDINQPCHVVASRSGVIKSIIVRRGAAIVKEGDTVTEGQIIVSGVTEGFVPVHADADVFARVWYEKDEKVSLDHKEIKETGKVKHRFSLQTEKFNINFWFNNDINYENYAVTDKKTRLKLWGNLYLPISINEQKIIEQEVNTVRLTKDEASVLYEKELYDKLLKEIKNVPIIKKAIRVEDLDENTIKLTLTLECEQKIDLQQKI